MKKVIGLTGGIASGKSTVSALLKKQQAHIIDADSISRSILKGNPQVHRELLEAFGPAYFFPNGELHRRKLGELVFNDENARLTLNKITHPRIVEAIVAEINYHKHNGSAPAIIVDAALLIEMDLAHLVDQVWLVAVPYEVQLNRLMKRDHFEKTGAENRIASQMSLEEKKQYADKVIDNTGDMAELEEQVMKIWQELLAE